MRRAARLVAPAAERGPEHGVALRAGVQADDPVGAERAGQHPGPEAASCADVDDATVALPREDAAEEADGLGAGERPAQVLRCPVLDAGGGERSGVPGPVASKASVGDLAGTPEGCLDFVEVGQRSGVVVSSGQGLELADGSAVHRSAPDCATRTVAGRLLRGMRVPGTWLPEGFGSLRRARL